MKILVISSTPWDNNNSFGSSYSNIFSEIKNIEFANIYCKPGLPCNTLKISYFQITEKDLIKNLFNPKHLSGKRITLSGSSSSVSLQSLNGETFGKKHRWQILFWIRDLIWKLGRWESDELKQFINDFKPDVIFQPVYYSSHMNDIVQWVKKYTQKPMLGYISDDCYTLKQLHFSPLYWLDRLWKRRKVKKTINQCEILYVISEIQKREYEVIFNVPCKILTKCADFSKPAPRYAPPSEPIKMFYAGNLGDGRWQSLAMLAKDIGKINQEKERIQLNIFTPTPFTNRMRRAFEHNGCTVHSPISATKVIELQKKSDILVHVEGLSLRSKWAVRQSFSTKLVDYFSLGKCIFAIGPNDVASIKHLQDNNAAVVASTQDSVENKLLELISSPSLIAVYGERAYQCGKKHHEKTVMQTMVINDIQHHAKNWV